MKGFASIVALGLLTACSGGNNDSAGDPGSEEPSTVDGPENFYLTVDGPLIVNGPPWDCERAGTDCAKPEAAVTGTFELVDGCVLLTGTEGPGRSVVVFRHGVSWNDADSTIEGLEVEPIPMGVAVTTPVAKATQLLPDWLEYLQLDDVPEQLTSCVSVSGSDYVAWNPPWFDPIERQG